MANVSMLKDLLASLGNMFNPNQQFSGPPVQPTPPDPNVAPQEPGFFKPRSTRADEFLKKLPGYAGTALESGVTAVAPAFGISKLIDSFMNPAPAGASVVGQDKAATPNMDAAQAKTAADTQKNQLRASATAKAKTGETPTVEETAQIIADANTKNLERQGITMTDEQRHKLEADAIDFVNRMSSGKRIDLLTAGLGILSTMSGNKSPGNVIGAGMLAGLQSASADQQEKIKNVLAVRNQQITQQNADAATGGVQAQFGQNDIARERNLLEKRGQDLNYKADMARTAAMLQAAQVSASASLQSGQSKLTDTDLKVAQSTVRAIGLKVGNDKETDDFANQNALLIKSMRNMGASNEDMLSMLSLRWNMQGGRAEGNSNFFGSSNDTVDLNNRDDIMTHALNRISATMSQLGQAANK